MACLPPPQPTLFPHTNEHLEKQCPMHVNKHFTGITIPRAMSLPVWLVIQWFDWSVPVVGQGH